MPSEIEDALRAQGMVVERVAGSGRYATARLLTERGIREGAFTDDVYLVTGEEFAYAMAAGAAIGKLGGSLVVVPPDGLRGGVRFLADRADEFVRVRIVGGSRVLSPRLADEVVELLRERRTRRA